MNTTEHMKVIVAHPGKQYVAALLEAIAQRGWLVRFYSQLISNKLPSAPQGSKLHGELRKYTYPNSIPASVFRHHPTFMVAGKVIGQFNKRHDAYLKVFERYDKWVAKSLEEEDFDIVIGYENSNTHTFRQAKKLGKTTVLDLAQIHHEAIVDILSDLWPADVLEQEINSVNPGKEAALQYTDHILTLSTFARQTMVDRGWPADRIHLVNLGINPEVFKPNGEPRPDQSFTFLFVGSIMLRKGIEDILVAFTELKKEGMEAQLTFIGPPEDGQYLLEEYAEHITYHSFLHHEELVNHYRHADVYVLPSLIDSWAQTVIEAMACGTAALVSDQTGAQDAVQRGGGWVVPAGDRAALKAQMRQCYEQPERVAELGRQAADLAQSYTWANYHKQVVDALTTIATKEHVPG